MSVEEGNGERASVIAPIIVCIYTVSIGIVTNIGWQSLICEIPNFGRDPRIYARMGKFLNFLLWLGMSRRRGVSLMNTD